MWLSVLAVVSSFKINPETRMFEDKYGRTTVFHGTNIVVKVPPYEPITDHFDYDMSICDEDIDYMHKWGLNFVRLGVMWEAVERSPG
mmetsp:Transcript_11391/g.1705  ORF Transcript_11391/g.1705 Transcript_11391/m.1705 type:complete len:87 (+) Transcript_11391:16-276(+)